LASFAHDHGLAGLQVMSFPGGSAFVGAGSFGIQLMTEQSQPWRNELKA
jgi:hypothetical protein